jgi:hypothetical protein
MTYRDDAMPPKTHIFPSRHTVQRYLEDYAEQHDLRQHIRFNTAVTHLKKAKDGRGWLLTSKSTKNENGSSSSRDEPETFSYVAICQGRCNTPNIPDIPGLETFDARIQHSAWYRDPSTYSERRILVVGNGSSAMDISRELTGYITRHLPSGFTSAEWSERCKKDPFTVYSSWHSLDKPPGIDYNPLDSTSPGWNRRIKVLPQIKHIAGSNIHFEDGTILDEIELIIFATGYLFDNAFIDQTVEPLLTRPLLPPSKHPSRTGFPSSTMYNLDDWLLFHSQDETIAFLGLPLVVVPFPFTQAQAIYVVHRWLGLAPSLPLLDINIAPNDASRWTSRRDTGKGEEAKYQDGIILEPASLTISHPSDFAYVDALLSLLKCVDPDAGKKAPWQQEYVSDGVGNGAPKGPEKFYATTQWRVERRANGKKLRREALGY